MNNSSARFIVIAILTVQASNLGAAQFCTSPIESGWASAPDESEARRRAILWWSSRAGAMGPGYESWDRAQRKYVLCEPRGNRENIRCKAVGSPCLPDGVPPTPKPGEKFIEL